MILYDDIMLFLCLDAKEKKSRAVKHFIRKIIQNPLSGSLTQLIMYSSLTRRKAHAVADLYISFGNVDQAGFE